VRFAPIRELASLRLDSSLRTLTLSPAGNDDRRNDNSMAVGFEQMDIVAEFNAPVGGWEALATRRSPCYFGVRLRLGGRGAGHAVWIQSHCNATVGADSEGCAALGHVSAQRMDQVFRNGAGAVPERAAELTLDRGDTTNVSGVPGGTRLLGGPLELPRGSAPLEMRILVDHSLVEAFAAGARNAFLEQ
jgi:hypothetical protein